MNSETTELAPVVQKRSSISKIWFVPILAAIIGLGMLIHQWQNQGVSIEISFDTAEGLEAGKTLVKYRSVDIGVVKSISFNGDQSKILVGVEVEKQMKPLLRSDTLFWVVRPRIGSGGVTGFGTLVSGAYIEISPGVDSVISRQYIGLEAPPVTSPSTPGIHLSLASVDGKPVKVGNPVMYRGFQVGRVEKVEFDTAKRTAKYDVFIDAPYDSLVTTNTHFWNVGGASLSTTASGVSVDIASVETLVSGGLEFDVPEGFALGERVENGHVFQLFDSKESVVEERQYRFLEYLVLVEDSVGGLNKGAPVEFRGIRIGTVERAQLTFEGLIRDVDKSQAHRVPVLVKIEPDRFMRNSGFTLEQFKEQVDNWILSGLTASIETANFLTGALKVSMDTSGTQRKSLETVSGVTVIPSAPGGFADITEKIESILTSVDQLPLDKTVDRMNKALATADKTLVSLERTLKEAEVTLQAVRPQADLYESIRATLLEFERTLDRVQPLLQEVGNQPNSLIFGGKKPLDKEPRAKQ